MSEATTPDVEETPEVAEAADLTDQVEEQAEGEEVDGDESGDEPDPEDDDLEDIEWEGRKFRAPAAVKAAMLREQDYTRKTQAVAEARRAVEERQTTLAQEAEAIAALREDIGAVNALERQVKAYSEVNWALLSQENSAEAQTLWMQYQQAKDELAAAKQGLSEKEAQRLQSQRQATAKAMEETGRVLSQEIPGFNATVAREIADYGIREFEIRQDEVQSMVDPRLWKVLHRAMSAEQKLAKLEKAQAVRKQQSVKPAAQVQAKASPVKPLDDRAATDAWMKARQAQVAKARA